MKIKLLTILAAILLTSVSMFAQKLDASSAVQSFYKFHRSRSGIFSSNEVSLRKKWFSDSLTNLFQTELKREKAYLKKNPTDKPHFGDGFPFQPYDECSQNGKSIKNPHKIGAITTASGMTYVEVKFYNPKACDGKLLETYKVELVNTQGKWLINDWIYSDGTKLTDDLKRVEY